MPAFQLRYRDKAPEAIRRTRPRQKDCYACMEYNYDWFCNDIDESYTTPANLYFSWQGRMRVTGGRTNVWGRQSYRLSDLPRASVLNPWLQTHDVPNLLVIDGSSFVSTACQNPTLTIMALALRACDHLLETMRRGEV